MPSNANKRTGSLDDELYRRILPIDIEDINETYDPADILKLADQGEENENDETHLNLIEEEKKVEVVNPAAQPLGMQAGPKQHYVDVTVSILRKIKPGEEINSRKNVYVLKAASQNR